MPPTLTAAEHPISRIFSRDFIFTIPGYQRPYAWTTEQAGELFDDLLGSFDGSQTAISDMAPYFLGSIVLIKGESRPNAHVVDGQQRLTTMTILLAAIRHSVGQGGSMVTPLIYEQGNPILGTHDSFRLSLRDRDSEFFQTYVQREGGLSQLIEMVDQLPASQAKIRENAKLFCERLALLSEQKRLSLATFLVTRCYLVVVATPDLDSAYRIFSVMNSRGLDLDPADILKAEIIGAIPSTQREGYTELWEDEEEDLGRELFSELFSHIRMIYRRSKPKGTLLKEFKEHVPGLDQPAIFIDTKLVPYANALGEISSSSYESVQSAERVNISMSWLNKLEFFDWVPPALEFTVRHRQRPDDMVYFFESLERLAYSMLIRRVGINERIERFSAVTGEIIVGDDWKSETSKLQLTEVEKRSFLAALDGSVYTELQARARTTLLLRLDALLSGGGANYDYENVTVEHVLPQTPKAGSQWLSWFPSEEQRELWTNRLANLVLLTRKKNSSASNYEFDKKKTAYFTKNGVSPFCITTQVLGHRTWEEAILPDRQSELVSTLSNHWRLAPASPPNT
jgi:hypothetical protein